MDNPSPPPSTGEESMSKNLPALLDEASAIELQVADIYGKLAAKIQEVINS